VANYKFYAAFTVSEEYSVMYNGKSLGFLPLESNVQVNKSIVYAGKAWYITAIDMEKKIIYLIPSKNGKAPSFAGMSPDIHTVVTQRMHRLLKCEAYYSYLDTTANQFIKEAREYYTHNIAGRYLYCTDKEIQVLTWLGTSTNLAIQHLLRYHDVKATCTGIGISIDSAYSVEQVMAAFKQISDEDIPPLNTLFEERSIITKNKWDWVIPFDLLCESYSSLYLSLTDAHKWIGSIV
jgi:ATP-dependent Lhr-like helicase